MYNECVARGICVKLVLEARGGSESGSLHCSTPSAAAATAPTKESSQKQGKKRPANERRRKRQRLRWMAWKEKWLHPAQTTAATINIAAAATANTAGAATTAAAKTAAAKSTSQIAGKAALSAAGIDTSSATAAKETAATASARSATSTPPRKKAKPVLDPTSCSSHSSMTAKRKAAASPEVEREAADSYKDLDLAPDFDYDLNRDLESPRAIAAPATALKVADPPTINSAFSPPIAPDLKKYPMSYLPAHPSWFVCSTCYKGCHLISDLQCRKCDEKHGKLDKRPPDTALHFAYHL
jgi:hypothetical protein